MFSIWIGLLLCLASFGRLMEILGSGIDQKGTIEAISVDTCTLQRKTHDPAKVTRVITPAEAGREGLDLRHDSSVSSHYTNFQTLRAWYDPSRNVSLGLKFYADVSKKSQDYVFLVFGDFYVSLLENGEIGMKYPILNSEGETKHRLDRTGIAMPAECINSGTNDPNTKDDSGWIELIGIKVKLLSREKRSSDEALCWKLIGAEFTYDHEVAHLDFYVNGEKIKRISFPKNAETSPITRDQPKAKITIARGIFSCIEVTQGIREPNYFTDFNLNECQKKYDGEPEQKFVNCLSDFKTPKTEQNKRGWLDNLPDYSLLFGLRDNKKR